MRPAPDGADEQYVATATAPAMMTGAAATAVELGVVPGEVAVDWCSDCRADARLAATPAGDEEVAHGVRARLSQRLVCAGVSTASV